jgi:uncharacterized protein YndB with AHSA1/START domain
VTKEPDEAAASVRIERTFKAPAQDVFEAWTSEDMLRRWWHAEHDWETPRAEVDLRPGGTIRLVMRNPVDGTDYGGGGEFTVIEPHRRLAFTWTWDDDPQGRRQLVDVEFIDRGDRTHVVMTHRGLPEGEEGDYREGWHLSFDNLDAALAA